METGGAAMGEEEEAAVMEGGGEVPATAAVAGGARWTAKPVHTCGVGGQSDRAHEDPNRVVGGPPHLPS